MSLPLLRTYRNLRRGIELGFFPGTGQPIVYDGTEPVAIDAQAGKGKLARFLGVNLVSPRTAHLTKIVTDPKNAELAWVSWKTLEREGTRVRFINPDGLHGFPSERYNPNTKLLAIAADPTRTDLVWAAAYDAASYLVPVDPDAWHRWIGQGVRTAFAAYYRRAALYPSPHFPCTPGGLRDFYGRDRAEIADDLLVWAADERMQDDSGMCRLIASFTQSPNQWNAYASTIVERLQGYRPGTAARAVTAENTFDPAEMKHERTALFIVGTAQSETSRAFVGMMTAAVIERFADAHGPLRALVVGEEWGQLYVSNFAEVLTLYRQAGINFLGVFQNAGAQIEARYGRETARLWKKAVAHTLYRGLPDGDTLRDIEHRSGKTSVMVRGFNVSANQVSGSGDTLASRRGPCSRSRTSARRRAARPAFSTRGIRASSRWRCRSSGSGPRWTGCRAMRDGSRVNMREDDGSGRGYRRNGQDNPSPLNERRAACRNRVTTISSPTTR